MEEKTMEREICIGDLDDSIGAYHLSLSRGTSRLEKLGEILVFPVNHVFIEAGQYTEKCYVIKKGRVVSYERISDEEERIYHLYEENSVFLESDLLYNRPSQVAFRASTRCELVCIDREVLMKAIMENTEIAMDIIESASMKLHSTTKKVLHMIKREDIWNKEWSLPNS